MGPLNVLLDSDPRLREVAKPVDAIDDQVIELAHEMLRVMYAANGLGLAAPQVGYPLRLIVVDVSKGRNSPLIMANPEIVGAFGHELGREACLSVPGRWGMVLRRRTITATWLDLEGKPNRRGFHGLAARAIQHEVDHLEGILYPDKAAKMATIGG